MKEIQRVFTMIKPDGVERRLVGSIINRIESTGLTIDAISLIRATPEQARAHYERKRNGSSGLTPEQAVEYLTSGSVVALIVSGDNALSRIRLLVGRFTDPAKCDVGSVRRDFGRDCLEIAEREARAVRNVIHSSSSYESAIEEIKIWFEARVEKGTV